MKGFLMLLQHAWDGVKHIGAQVWQNNLVPAAHLVQNMVLGAVAGSVIPAVQDAFSSQGFTLLAHPFSVVPVAVGAFLTGLFTAAQHSPNQVISTLAANVKPDQVAQAAQAIDDAVAKALTKKTSMVLLLLVLGVGSAVANPIGVPLNPPAGGEDAFLLAPVGALEFNPTNSSNYGLAFSESLGLARVNRVDDHHVSVDPYFFFGVFGAARISEWVNTNGNAPWSVDYGLMIGLPKLDESLPEVAFSETWNTIDRGDAKLFINVAFPVDILPDIFCRKINL